jgi:hypothetical protein
MLACASSRCGFYGDHLVSQADLSQGTAISPYAPDNLRTRRSVS